MTPSLSFTSFAPMTIMLGAALIGLTATPSSAHAAHPLITEDTGTQGQGRWQLELTGDIAYRDPDYAAAHERAFAATLSYGAYDELDIIFTLPYRRLSESTDSGIDTHRGRGDAGLDLKWRYYEREELSFAFKPGVTFATGDETVGLGTGRRSYSLYHVISYEPEPWAVHLHLGYVRNRNRLAQREGLWHASVGGWRSIGNLKLVGDIGLDTNADKSSKTEPAFLILGTIYSIRKDFDFDLGVKRGLSTPATDYTLLVGTAFRF